MTGQFDPYRTWLGIPPDRQPPNHYDLLGIPLFEEDPTVITHAADQRMGFLRTFQAGAHQAESQRLLNEVAAARVCLLNAEKKAAYDRRLRAEIAASESSQRSGPARSPARKPRPKPAPLPLSGAQPVPAAQAAAETPGTSTPAGTPLLPRPNANVLRILKFAAAGFALVVLVGLVAWLASRPGGTPPDELANRPEVPAPAPEQPEGPTPPPEQPEGPTPPPEQPEGPTPPPEQPEGPTPPPEQPEGPTPPPEQPPVTEGPLPGTPPPEQPEGPAPARLPMPSATEQEELRKRLDEIYDLQAERTAEKKVELARRLAQLAEGAELEPAERFVVLRSAAELAVEGGELDWAFDRLEQMGESYVFDVLAAQVFFFAQSAERAADDRAVGELVRTSKGLTDRAVAAKRYELALSVADAAYEVSRRLPGRPYREEVYNLRTEMTHLNRQWQAAQEARARLEADPDDAEAHLTLGRAMCFLWDEWPEGLAHLAKGSDERLAQAASADLASDPADATQCVRAADVWWDLAEQSRGEDHSAFQRRAAWWYRRAVPGLSGLELVKATERLKKLDQQLAAGGGSPGSGVPAAPARMPELEVVGEPVNLGPIVNSTGTDECPRVSADGRNLLFQSYRRVPGPLSRYARGLWMCSREKPNQPWGPPVYLPRQFNRDSYETDAFVSADGLCLLFAAKRSDTEGSYDLYVSTRPTVRAAWVEPINLGPAVNSSYDDREPYLSPDGRTLLFSSNRLGGHGAHDIWMSTRDSLTDPWSKPVNLEAPVNSAFYEGSPSLSRDGRMLIFHSTRDGGVGSYDLYMAARRTTEEPWGEPVNLQAINSTSTDSQPFLNADGTELYFASSRPGGRGGRDLWVCRVNVK